MTETFFAIGAMMIALSAVMMTAAVLTGAVAGWRDWQRERASWNGKGGYLVTLDRHVIERLAAMRRSRESYSDVILRLALAKG